MTDFEENFTSERAETSEQFGKVPTWLLDTAASGNAIRVYAYLDAKFGNSKRGIFPSQETIANANHVSVRSVQRILQELQEVGALTVRRRGLGRTNLYRLMWRNPAKPAPVAKKTARAAFTDANRRTPPRTARKPAACAAPAREAVKVNSAELERQAQRRDADERQRAQEEANRKARQAEREQMRLDSALDGLAL